MQGETRWDVVKRQLNGALATVIMWAAIAIMFGRTAEVMSPWMPTITVFGTTIALGGIIGAAAVEGLIIVSNGRLRDKIKDTPTQQAVALFAIVFGVAISAVFQVVDVSIKRGTPLDSNQEFVMAIVIPLVPIASWLVLELYNYSDMINNLLAGYSAGRQMPMRDQAKRPGQGFDRPAERPIERRPEQSAPGSANDRLKQAAADRARRMAMQRTEQSQAPEATKDDPEGEA